MIESARYQSDGSVLAVIDGITITVPDDPDNRHRQMLAAWEEDGSTIAPADEPPAATIISYAAFRARWTDDELQALFAAKAEHWQAEDLFGLAVAQNSVNLSGPSAAAAKGLFVTLGVLTEERAAIVFAVT